MGCCMSREDGKPISTDKQQDTLNRRSIQKKQSQDANLEKTKQEEQIDFSKNPKEMRMQTPDQLIEHLFDQSSITPTQLSKTWLPDAQSIQALAANALGIKLKQDKTQLSKLQMNRLLNRLLEMLIKGDDNTRIWVAFALKNIMIQSNPKGLFKEKNFVRLVQATNDTNEMVRVQIYGMFKNIYLQQGRQLDLFVLNSDLSILRQMVNLIPQAQRADLLKNYLRYLDIFVRNQKGEENDQNIKSLLPFGLIYEIEQRLQTLNKLEQNNEELNQQNKDQLENLLQMLQKFTQPNDHFYSEAFNLSLNDLFNLLKDESKIEVPVNSELRIHHPTTKATVAAIVIDDKLSDLQYPETDQLNDIINAIEQADAIKVLKDGLSSDIVDLSEAFLICLANIMKKDKPEFAAQFEDPKALKAIYDFCHSDNQVIREQAEELLQKLMQYDNLRDLLEQTLNDEEYKEIVMKKGVKKMNKRERLRAAKELKSPPSDLILEMLKDWSEIDQEEVNAPNLPNPNTMDQYGCHVLDQCYEQMEIPDSIVDALLANIDNGNEAQRQWASYMLAKLGEKVPSNYILTNYGLGVLYKGLQDLNPQVRLNCQKTLQNILEHSPESLNKLIDYKANAFILQMIENTCSFTNPEDLLQQLESLEEIMQNPDIKSNDLNKLLLQYQFLEKLQNLKQNLPNSAQEEEIKSKIDNLQHHLELFLADQNERQSTSSNQTVDAYILQTKNMTLAELIDNLPNLTPIRATYTHETWAERPLTRGSYSSLRISEILSQKDYPQCKDVQEIKNTIKEHNAIQKLVDGLLSDMRDMREVFSVCLGFMVPEADCEELEIFMREDILAKIDEHLSDDKEDFVKQTSEVVTSLCEKSPAFKHTIYNYNNQSIIQKLIEFTRDIKSRSDMVNHLMFLRDLYIYEDDSGEIEINENVMKRLTELNLEDFIAQAFEDIERLPKGDEETEENLQDLKEYFGDELGIEL